MSQTKAQLLDGKSATIQYTAGSASAPAISFTGDTNTGIYSPGADQVAVSTNGTGRLSIDANGNVAVDTNTLYVDAVNNRVAVGTTSPDATLDVVGVGAAIVRGGDASKPRIFLEPIAGGAQKIVPYQNGVAAGCQLAFCSGEAGSERARIDVSGRLLVGTSSARTNFFNGSVSALYQIEGANNTDQRMSAQIYGSADAASSVYIFAKHRSNSIGGTTLVSADDELGQISFQGSDGSQFVASAQISAFVDGTPGADDMPGRLVFSTTRDGQASPTIGMSLLNTGELRIGSTDQTKISTDPVHTIGDVSLATVQTNLARLVMQERVNNWISFKGASGTHHGTISVSGAGVSYGSNSDYRLKENITSIEKAIQKLKLAKPCQYNFIAFPNQRIDGFIAHELQEVVPSAVSGIKDAVNADGDPEYQTVDASKLVPLLTAALQEAVAKIESLEARLTAAGI